jgi:hypothetical protein
VRSAFIHREGRIGRNGYPSAPSQRSVETVDRSAMNNNPSKVIETRGTGIEFKVGACFSRGDLHRESAAKSSAVTNLPSTDLDALALRSSAAPRL